MKFVRRRQRAFPGSSRKLFQQLHLVIQQPDTANHDRSFSGNLKSELLQERADADGGVDVDATKQLDGIDEVRTVARTGFLGNDLENLFAQLAGRVKTLQFVRSSKKLDKHKQMSGVETSDHLARLWANDEVGRILAPRDESLTAEARSLAIQYQLVTPVTGAVVLETAEQYRASGLQPVNAGTVPTIPEPGMVALLIVAGAFLIWLTYMKHRKQSRGTCTL